MVKNCLECNSLTLSFLNYNTERFSTAQHFLSVFGTSLLSAASLKLHSDMLSVTDMVSQKFLMSNKYFYEEYKTCIEMYIKMNE